MSAREFDAAAKKLDGKADNIFLHVMGEPLLHPELGEILKILDGMEHDVSVKITTNGTLLRERLPALLGSKRLKTLCISLHSFEANSGGELNGYISNCLDAALRIGESGKFAVLRLWNDGGLDSLNPAILGRIKERFPEEGWEVTRRGMRVARHIFLEFGDKFNWPESGESLREYEVFEPLETDCHGLLTQFAILADGTAVPCCLDRNGDIPLGNIFHQTVEEILSSPRAKKMRDGMASHSISERLCATCGKRKGSFQR